MGGGEGDEDANPHKSLLHPTYSHPSPSHVITSCSPYLVRRPSDVGDQETPGVAHVIARMSCRVDDQYMISQTYSVSHKPCMQLLTSPRSNMRCILLRTCSNMRCVHACRTCVRVAVTLLLTRPLHHPQQPSHITWQQQLLITQLLQQCELKQCCCCIC